MEDRSNIMMRPRGRTADVTGTSNKFDTQRGGIVGEAALLMGGHSSDSDAAQEEVLNHRRSSFSNLLKRNTKQAVGMEDLIYLREYIMSEVKSHRQDTLAKVSHLTAEVEKLRQELYDQRNHDDTRYAEFRAADRQEAHAYTTDCAQRLAYDIVVSRATFEEQLRQSFDACNQRLDQLHAKMVLAHERQEHNVNVLVAQQTAATAVRWASGVALLNVQRLDLDARIDKLRGDFERMHGHDFNGIIGDFKEFTIAQRERDALQDAAMIENHNELRRLIDSAEKLAEQHTKNVDEHIKKAFATVDEMSEGADRRIKVVEAEAQRLFNVVSEVENIPTRRVEWVIQDAAVRLNAVEGKSWVSPKFEAAGAHGLQLELKLVSPEPASEPEGEPVLQGNCTLYLWAEASGLRMVCKLYVGTACTQLQHTFDGCTPCGTTSFNCYLKDQISPDDGSLRVGLEVLEAVREVQNLPRPPSAGKQQRGEFLDGPMVSHRYLNHRTLELVQTQVDLMRSRMVRRIEWRLEQASMLRRYFPEGESLCSTTFEAAGVGGMQLVFYPSGYAGVKEGYSSFFLHLPEGSALHCWLIAGKQRREAKLAFEQSRFFGRTNFCRYENCIDPVDDTVLLVLEIGEAQQDIKEPMWHKPMPPPVERRNSSFDRRPMTPTIATKLASPPPTGKISPTEALVEKIDSNVKLKRAPGKVALEDVMQLPSIWTSKMQGNLTEALEGFRTFGDLKNKKPLSARQPLRNVGPTATPLIATRYNMYAT